MPAVMSNKNRVDLLDGPILKSLLMFAVPIILASLIQQLYTTIDLIIIGQFVGSVGTVGVSVGSELPDMFTPIAMAFSTAGQIYIAQLYGAGKYTKIKTTIGTLLFSCFLFPLRWELARFSFLGHSSHG